MSPFKEIWDSLIKKGEISKKRDISSLFTNKSRYDNFSSKFNDILIDYSKTNLDDETFQKLMKLIQISDLYEKQVDLFKGKNISPSKEPSPIHVLYRRNIFKKTEKTLLENNKRMFKISEDIRDGKYLNVKGQKFKSIVNIGIGGSRNGSELIYDSLKIFSTGPKVFYISSMDDTEFNDTVYDLDPYETLFVVVSKSFKSIETIQNTRKALFWLKKSLNCDVSKHFICVTSNKEEAKKLLSENIEILNVPSGLGGRFGLLGPYSLSSMCNIGFENYNQMLEGANQIDDNFYNEKNKDNLSLVLSIIDIWHRNFCNFQTKAILPYDYNLKFFVNYIQQLEMESNGKSINYLSQKNKISSSPIVWGSSGSEGQHSFFQFLHQGSNIVPCDFLIGINDQIQPNSKERTLLLKNCLAQSEALMVGSDKSNKNIHEFCEGNRPSTTIFYESLSPKVLGSLIALYENKNFINSVIWRVNPFDQWGVENAKKIFSKFISEEKNDYYNKIIKKFNN